ncbi:MAG: BMC domain-containing protein [Ignavibacteria bacterium]|nr:BMC domain-containing protein [Ignavibacteria bacterium]
MLEYALGLIETKGLVGSIEAADVMLKTANVRLLGTEFIKNGLVTVQIIGEVAAVKAAVDAASAAVARVSQLISTHVIPRPAEDIENILTKYPPVSPAVKKSKPPSADQQESLSTLASLDNEEYRSQLNKMTVHQLRTLARETGGLGIAGREISKAKKELLISELLRKRTGS